MWIYTNSVAGGASPVVRYEDVRYCRPWRNPDDPHRRSMLVLADGTEIPCQATIETMRRRLLDAEQLASHRQEVLSAVRVVLETDGLRPPLIQLALGR
jgi:hypothetical protein